MNDKLKNLLGFVADRLSEQSTWKGIIGLLTAAGATLKPDQIYAAASYIYTLRGSNPPKPKPPENTVPVKTGPSEFE